MARTTHQASLFAVETATHQIADGDMTYLPGWLDPATADRFLDEVLATSAWRQEVIRMFGRRVPVPRITAWHADAGCCYTYSGITHESAPWTPVLDDLRRRVADTAGARFNSVLVNRYRDGRDGVAWHSDDEPELGGAPVIGSVSLGATRRFHVRRRADPGERHDLDLDHGSLLVMHAGSQTTWEHRVPKTARPVGERINLTFRLVEGAAG